MNRIFIYTRSDSLAYCSHKGDIHYMFYIENNQYYKCTVLFNHIKQGYNLVFHYVLPYYYNYKLLYHSYNFTINHTLNNIVFLVNKTRYILFKEVFYFYQIILLLYNRSINDHSLFHIVDNYKIEYKTFVDLLIENSLWENWKLSYFDSTVLLHDYYYPLNISDKSHRKRKDDLSSSNDNLYIDIAIFTTVVCETSFKDDDRFNLLFQPYYRIELNFYITKRKNANSNKNDNNSNDDNNDNDNNHNDDNDDNEIKLKDNFIEKSAIHCMNHHLNNNNKNNDK